MHRRHWQRIGSAFAVLLLATVLSRAEEKAIPEPRVSVLIKDVGEYINPAPPPRYIDVLESLGLIADVSAGKDNAPLAWKKLKKYQVLVMTNFDTIHERKWYDHAELADLVNRFLEEGGGVFFLGMRLMSDHEAVQSVNRWLKPHGAEIRWGTIEDEAHAYDNPPHLPYQRKGIFYTTNMAEHPVTKGVKTLFLRNHLFYSPYLCPIEVDGNWTVVARAMDTAKTYDVTVPPNAGICKRIDDSAKTGPAPLLAVRQVGKGRLALFAHDPGPFLYDLGKPAIGAICQKNGDGERASDWLPMLRNLALWLSEPARKNGKPGGVMQKAEFAYRPDWGSRDAIDWERPDISWPDSEINRLYGVHSAVITVPEWREMVAGDMNALKILLGPRTALSGGKGTVADWKKAALAAGFSGIAFREDILNLSEKQWADFQAQCLAATDDTFIALPGQEFAGWEGNRFFRFNRFIPWHGPERLTKDGKAVREQLHFFFDAGHGKEYPGLPANMPLRVQGNDTPWWSYRVYDALPVYVYEGTKRIEENRAAWTKLVERIEYPSPVAIYMLDDPAQVAQVKDLPQVNLIAPSVRSLREDPRWQRRAMGLGQPNNPRMFLSDGPEIQAFTAIANYRTTLGSRAIGGSYRYRIFLRASSEAPITTVEYWGGTQLLRRIHPNKKQVLAVIEDIHDAQRGIWARVEDAEGREALVTGMNVHDKMMYLQYCGDHCNMLGAGAGVDEEGNPIIFGNGTHVRMKYGCASGPGAAMAEAWDFIPYGTDTSIPTLGLWGDLKFLVEGGSVPSNRYDLVPELFQWYGNRNVLVNRLDTYLRVDRARYMGKDAPMQYDSGYFSGWGAYFKTEPLESFTVVHDDVDIQRDAGEPAFQYCRGTVRFKKDVTLDAKKFLNLQLGRSTWKVTHSTFYTAEGAAEIPANLHKKLGKGGYLTFTKPLGHGSLIGLDDHFGVEARIDEKTNVFFFGESYGEKTFKAGDELRYSFLIMRWPLGMNIDAGLDKRVVDLLGFGEPGKAIQLTATRGKAGRADFGFLVETDGPAFAGELTGCDLRMQVLVRAKGLNPNWAGGVWTPGRTLFAPLAPDPDGVTWGLVDPTADAGPVFFGNVLACENPDVLLRLLQRTDGGFDILAHNPLAEKVAVTVRGVSGGPVPGVKKTLSLAPGEEVRWAAE